MPAPSEAPAPSRRDNSAHKDSRRQPPRSNTSTHLAPRLPARSNSRASNTHADTRRMWCRQKRGRRRESDDGGSLMHDRGHHFHLDPDRPPRRALSPAQAQRSYRRRSPTSWAKHSTQLTTRPSCPAQKGSPSAFLSILLVLLVRGSALMNCTLRGFL